MGSSTPALLALAESVVGPLRGHRDLTRDVGRRNRMIEVHTADGRRVFVKQHEHRTHYRAESQALRDWVPTLKKTGWAAPELLAHDDERAVIVISAVAGDPVPPGCVPAFETAGRVAAALHRSSFEPLRTSSYPAGERLNRVRAHIPAAMFEWLCTLDLEVSTDGWGPIHGDFSPRNWLWDDSSQTLAVLDWERTRLGPWQEDAQRMVPAEFHEIPATEQAYWRGYGGRPDEVAAETLQRVVVLNAVASVVWADETGDRQFYDAALSWLRRWAPT